jgi:formylglycine-generating enzyme required for sulfatase activity
LTLVEIPAGEFTMGSDRHYPDEGPARLVQVGPISVAPHTVTNDQFGAFVKDTGFVTEAEIAPKQEMYPHVPAENLVPGALVFTMTDGPVPLNNYANWWQWTPGADWRHPTGSESSIEGLDEHPVVQVCHGDAVAYCEWAGLELPTEEEWEHAARGGLDGAEFVWGDEDPQETGPLANTWQGGFPFENTEIDGFTRTSPVGTYPPNGHGLYDMAGNVWEWTSSWYSDVPAENPTCCAPEGVGPGTLQGSYDPLEQAVRIPRKVVKGGSHLCTPQYCFRYRPAARQPQTIETATSHMGFRGIRRDT